MQKNICEFCGKEFFSDYKQKFCCQKHYGEFLKEQKADEIFYVPEEKIFIRIVSPTEEYCFNTLRKAVNFLSVYSSADAADCLEKISNRKNKIGNWKIFYD